MRDAVMGLVRLGTKGERGIDAALRLPVSRTAMADQPAQQGVRLHDLRHTVATMQSMAGVHFMQVSKCLGHSTFVLTLDSYGDWIPEEDGGALNDLPEPTALDSAVVEQAVREPTNVVQLFGR